MSDFQRRHQRTKGFVSINLVTRDVNTPLLPTRRHFNETLRVQKALTVERVRIQPKRCVTGSINNGRDILD